LSRNVIIISLICSIILLETALPSNATVPSSSNTGVALDNATSLNQTITNLVNQTITNLANQTLTGLNETVSEQARFAEEAREGVRANATAATEEVRNEVRGAFVELPATISIMLGIAVIFVIAIPVIIDLLYPNRKGRGDRSDLYRALMTFGVIIVVGIVVVYLITLINFNISATDNNNVEALIEVLRNLSTILGTALAAIVAFYFGAKSAQGEGGPPRPQGEGGPPRPQGG
jgi:hypothetical protein